MAYTLVAQGDKWNFGTGVDQAVATKVEEGGEVEVRMTFDFRFPGFETAAVVYENNLRSEQHEGEYIQPWDGNYQIVYVDPDKPVWYVRYKKGSTFGLWLAACIIIIGIAWISFSIWQLLKFIAGLLPSLPWLIPFVGVGLVTVAVINSYNELRKTEVTTKYSGGNKPPNSASRVV